MFRTGLALSLALLSGGLATGANAKTPGKTYCFNGICHTVKTLEETRRLVGQSVTVKASFYDDPKKDRFNPTNLTSSGEYFRAWKADNAASPIYPNGTKLLVWHSGSRKALVVRVNNAGPYWGDRKLDLSRAAGEVLGMGSSGVATVQVKVLEAPTKEEATYRLGRTYAPVKGYLGQYASAEAAFSSASGSTSAPAAIAAVAKPKPVVAPIAVAAAKPAKQSAPVVVASAPAVPDPKPEPKSAVASVRPVTDKPVIVASAPIVDTTEVRLTPEDLPVETPIEVKSKKREKGDNPLAEAIGLLAAREELKLIRVAQQRLDRPAPRLR